MALRDLWRWDGKVSRKSYALVGLIGFAIKHNLDRLIATRFFHSSTGQGFVGYWFNYWAPLGRAARLTHLSAVESKFLATMLLVAMPFIWVGVAMTVRRLRDTGLPVWLVILFFVPFLNLLFFAALCVLPPRERGAAREAAPWPGPRSLDSLIPRSRTGGAVVAIVLTSAIGLVFVLLGTEYEGAYGWSLFLGLPFCLGLFSVLVYSYHERRMLGACLQVAVLPVGILGFLLVAIAVEGVICAVMGAPLALALTALGGWVGYLIQANHWGSTHAPAMMSVVLLVVPAFFGMERAIGLEPPTFVVRTAIEVKAPPAAVWQEVVAFEEIPPPTEMLFRAGIAYPIRAEISGRGPGAIRRCVFSTGPFVEPIEIWDEPRLLKFGVTANPAPLNELTPYGHIEPRHLHGYFVSEEGQFLLTPLPGGGTRLEGTTWYRNAIWPSAYWHLWSDYIIHRIHLRVLRHIRDAVEASGAGAGGFH
jgi:uncharacterized membrane protein YhaH (DUF805 family)